MGASLLRMLPFFSVFFIFGMGLAIPHRALNPLVVPLSLVPAADKDFVTVYGLCDSSAPRQQQDAAPSDGGSRLKPIQDDFLATTEATTPGSPGQGGKGLPTPTSLVTFRAFQPTPSPTFSPMRGPGLVALSSSVYSAILATNPTPSPVRGSSTTRIITPSTRIIVIASVIGGILSIALCVFLFTNPTLRRKLCGIFACKKRKKSTNAKGVFPSSNVDQPPSPDRTLTEKIPSATKHDEGPGETLDNIAPPKNPASEFSVHSSEYTDTPRVSILASPGTSKPTTPVTFAPPPNSPPRPCRPPTEDSPALSDSVYLACSDQPYVIGAPRPFSEADMNNSSPATNRKRLLTPSQFFALHVPGLLANLSISKSSASDAARKRESQHSPTKNTLLSGSRTSKASPSAEDSTENDAALTGPVLHKAIKHRKSRSASGWAYPTRL